MIAVVAIEVAVTVDNGVEIVREIGAIPMIVDPTLAGKEALAETITGKEATGSVESEAEV